MSDSSLSRMPPGPLPEGASRPAAWARGGLLGAWALAAGIHLLATPDLRERIWPLGYLLMEILATASLAWRAWRGPGGERRAWGLLALSSGLEVPNLVLGYLRIVGWLGAWVQGAVNLLSLGTGVLVLVGVLSFPREPEPAGRLRRRALDGLIFAASLLFLLWTLGLRSLLANAGQGMGQRMAVDYLNAALLGGGIVFMASDRSGGIRGPLGWLGASALAWLVGLSWWTLAGFHGTQAQGGWVAVVAAIPLFQGLAAWSPRPVTSRAEFPDGSGSRAARLLPYLPVVGAVAVLAFLLPRPHLELLRGAIGLFLVLVVLLLLRQFQAITDLQTARRTLEARVLQRTRALEQAQDTLLRTERLNTLALMGAGVAHDLNNLLTAIKGTVEMALVELEEGQALHPEQLVRVVGTAERAATLTRRLMGFGRREAEALGPLDVCAEIRDMEDTLHLLVPRDVDFQIHLPEAATPLVSSSRGRLEQMLVNLVANAVDAMPSGGRLDLRVVVGGPDPSFVDLEVCDSGCGMAPEVLERIFDPFFTTKAPGKGTGLGLSSLKALLEEAGGRWTVDSRPGEGTRFHLLLPTFEPPPNE